MLNILITSDQMLVLKVCARALTNEGYHVSITQEPEVLEQCIKEFCPDAVLLDRLSDSFDAFGLLLEIRHKFPEIPVLIFIYQSTADIDRLIQVIPYALQENRLKLLTQFDGAGISNSEPLLKEAEHM